MSVYLTALLVLPVLAGVFTLINLPDQGLITLVYLCVLGFAIQYIAQFEFKIASKAVDLFLLMFGGVCSRIDHGRGATDSRGVHAVCGQGQSARYAAGSLVPLFRDEFDRPVSGGCGPAVAISALALARHCGWPCHWRAVSSAVC